MQDDAALRFVPPETESIPIAITLNELPANAIEHSPQGEMVCQTDIVGQANADGEADADTRDNKDSRGEGSADTVRVRIASTGSLHADFDLSAFRDGVSGLGLVRSLLPRCLVRVAPSPAATGDTATKHAATRRRVKGQIPQQERPLRCSPKMAGPC